MKTYVNTQKPKTISEVIHHSLVAAKIFPSNKPAFKPMDKGEKAAPSDRPGKDQKNNQGKNKNDKGKFRGQSKLSPEELERRKKENRCFGCGETGHMSRACPNKGAKKEVPQATQILSHEVENPQASQLCYVWGKIRDQSAFMLLDPGSTHNFISTELAQRLGIQYDEMGTPLEATGAFKGQPVPITPLIGELRLHIDNYSDTEEFYVSPLEHEDVILGTPWFHRLYAKMKFPERTVTFTHMGREFTIQAQAKGNTIPIVSNDAIKKVMKKSLFAYMVYVKDSPSNNVVSKSVN